MRDWRAVSRQTIILTEKLIKYDFVYCLQNCIKIYVQLTFFSRVGETFTSIKCQKSSLLKIVSSSITPTVVATTVRTKQYMYVAHASLTHSKNMLR
jgi:hypothetical protein